MTGLAVRAATADDAAAILEIERLANPHPWSADALGQTLAQPTTRAWVAAVGPEVAGHLVTSGTGVSAEILLLAVRPERRRERVATALILAARSAWVESGLRELWLDVRADNEPALALYGDAGFCIQGIRRAYYRDGTDAVLMCWRTE